MDEIAPEYDVVVLGTGAIYPAKVSLNKLAEAVFQASQNVCSLGNILNCVDMKI